jgi:hypothetical protein
MIVIVVLLIIIFNAIESYEQNSCSRELSRKVRQYIVKEIYPLLSLDELPDTCQLNPKYDMYLVQENARKEIEKGDWKCNFCNKHFKNEFYMDRHMDNKHQDKLQNSTSICLADLCPIFGCDKLTDKSINKIDKQFIHKQSCSKEDEEKNKYKCQILMKRCFINTKNEKIFHDKVCSKIHCEKGQLMGSIIENNENNISYWLLQLVLAFVILIGLAFYALATDSFTKIYVYFTKKSIPTRSKESSLLSSFFVKKKSNKKIY